MRKYRRIQIGGLLGWALGFGCSLENPGYSGSGSEAGGGDASSVSSDSQDSSSESSTTTETTFTSGMTATGSSGGETSGGETSTGDVTTGPVTGGSTTTGSTTTTGDTTTDSTTTTTTGNTDTGDMPEPNICGIPYESLQFGGVVPLMVGEGEERDPVLRDDGKVLFYTESGLIHYMTRGGLEQPFVNPQSADKILGMDKFGSVTKISFFDEDHDVYFSSTWKGGKTNVWWAHRNDVGLPFETASEVTGISDPGSGDYDAHISQDGLRIYAAPASGPQNLYVAVRGNTDVPFNQRTPMDDVNSPQSDADPAFSADETVMIFTSNRPGSDATDMYIVKRGGPMEAFGEPDKVEGMNSPADDGDAFIADSELGCELFFSSTRVGAPGGRDLYRAQIFGG